MSNDPTTDFLQSLPEIHPGEQFWFACHPGVPCFNACCGDLTMPLTPYDVLRLRKGLNMGSEEFFEEFATVGAYPDTGFPLLHLRMLDGPGRPCPFVTEEGCGVYEHRSAACRTYPLGRATQPGGEGASLAVTERYFLVREGHCRGFEESRALTIGAWLADQGLEPYNAMNDRYMLLMGRYKAVAEKAILSGRHATMALLCLYQQDRFLDFIADVKLFDRVTLCGEWGRPEAVSAIMADEEQRLRFAFDWLELVLLGKTPNLRPA